MMSAINYGLKNTAMDTDGRRPKAYSVLLNACSENKSRPQAKEGWKKKQHAKYGPTKNSKEEEKAKNRKRHKPLPIYATQQNLIVINTMAYGNKEQNEDARRMPSRKKGRDYH